MIKKIKEKLPNNFKKLLRHLYFFNNSVPYSYFQPSFDQFNLSDFFLFRCDNFDTIFIADNNLALLSAKPIECRHIFYFYSVSGSRCGRFEVTTDLFHYHLKINSQMTGGELIGGFIHQTIYSDDSLKKETEFSSEKLLFQHRGYTGYRRKGGDSYCYSFLHGNFGAMYIKNGKLLSLSRQRALHSYSPQIQIKINKFYEFYFTNPTSKDLKLDITLTDQYNKSHNVLSVKINPMGSYKFNLASTSKDLIRNISWTTRLPIGRAIVFENDGIMFDVYHS